MTQDVLADLKRAAAAKWRGDPAAQQWGLFARAVAEIERLVAERDAAAVEERERCARVADEHAKRSFPWGSENADIYHAQADWAEAIAKSIRQLRPTEDKNL